MADITVPQVDFGILGNLGNTYQEAQAQSLAELGRRKASEALGRGDTQAALAALVGSGDSRTLAALGQYQVGANSVYGTPIYGTDTQGNTKIGTFDKSGRFRPVETPGFTPTLPTKTVDTGTGTQLIPGRMTFQGGQPVPQQPPMQGGPTPSSPQPAPAPPRIQGGYIPKDVAGEASARSFGKEHGEAQANLASVKAKLPGLMQVVDELGAIGDKATYTAAGQLYDAARKQFGASPRDAAVARTTYIAMVDNQILPMLRDTFGAQFTVREGDTLRSTLGDPDKTPQEKRAVLNAFINQKVRNIQALELQTSAQPQNQTSQQQRQPVRKSIGGKNYIQINGQWYQE